MMGTNATGAKLDFHIECKIRAMLRDGESVDAIGRWLLQQILTPHELRFFQVIEQGDQNKLD
jgi:hypothetical protein